jgi:hypothetical protein
MTQQFHFQVDAQQNWRQGLRHLYSSVHNSITYNNQKMETLKWPAIDENKENALCTYSWKLFSLEKEWELEVLAHACKHL